VAGFEYEWDLSAEWTFTTDTSGEFTVTADPAPGGRLRSDGLHTFRIRAVDDDDLVDPTPAERTFNATSIAPSSNIISGPMDGATAAPYVRFELEGTDDDGIVVATRWTLRTLEEYFWDTGRPYTTLGIVAWADTLTYRPLPGGGYDTSVPAWTTTAGTEVVFPALDELDSRGLRAVYVFSARAVDDAGVVEPDWNIPGNTRTFNVSTRLAGPRLFVSSEELALERSSGDPPSRVAAFSHPVSFQWDAVPGQSGLPVDAFSWAWGDTTNWSPWSQVREYPPGGGQAPLPVGPARLFVRARDTQGFTSIVEIPLDVYPGPRDCPPQDRSILVVLDTDAETMISSVGVFPPSYEVIERALVDSWFQDFAFQLHETDRGRIPLEPALLSCAGTTVWIHSSTPGFGDNSLLLDFHRIEGNRTLLPSYVNAGGNFILCGLQPSEAIRYFRRPGPPGGNPVFSAYPLNLESPAIATAVPHWMATGMGVASIESTVTNTDAYPSLRLGTATSAIAGYPDLPFDPLTWPDGPRKRGFGFYDRGVQPVAGAEVLYAADGSGPPLAVRHLVAPGPNGNAIYLGIHPYFVERPAFRAFLAKALTDFGESPVR
ncbi:MAG TPA: hypothetical protein VKU85_16795, partial [bacterium]|nr:hypothetical protein [bacterium]